MKMQNWVGYRLVSFVLLLGLAATITACRLGQGGATPEAEPQSQPPPAQSGPGLGLPPGISGVVLFQDDFQDGQADGWSINSAWNVQQNGDMYTLRADGDGGAWVTNGGNWQNYIFRVGVRLESGSFLMSMNLTQSGRYMLHIREDGIYLLKEQPAGNYVILTQTGPFTMNAPHSVAIANQDGRLQVYVDQILWIDYTDNLPILAGTIAVTALDGSRVAVDNVVVLSLSAPLPAGIVQAPPPAAAAPDPAEIAPPEGGGLEIVDVDPEPDDSQVQDQPSVGQPDLAIDRVTIQPAAPEQNQPVTVAVIVQNGGDGHAGAFNVVWQPEGSFVGCNWDIFGLPAGEVLDMVCDYQGYPTTGAFYWVASVDPDNEVPEMEDGNNSQSDEILVVPGLQQEPPPAPIGCMASTWTMNSVTLAWEFPGNEDNIDGFGIYQGVTSLEKWVGSQSRSTTIENLEQGVQYHFDVRANNAAGESAVDVCFVDVTLNP